MPPRETQPAGEISQLSPAKINLFLDVVGRRADGYHEVVTVIEPLALYDRLHFRDTPAEISVTADRPDVPGGEDNIVHRAARLLLDEAKAKRGISITIEKSIPAAAGLGGGSGDAAAALLTLNELWKLRLPETRLSELAARLGSDVPFFLRPRTSLWRSRGERGEPLPPAPPFSIVLINPGFPLSTRTAYEELGIRGPAGKPHPRLGEAIAALENSDLERLGRSLYNRFQENVSARHPRVRELLNFFRREKAVGAVLCGSGPTVAGLAASRERAEEIGESARNLFPEVCRVIVTSNYCPPTIVIDSPEELE